MERRKWDPAHAEARTFTGAIQGLEVGNLLIVLTYTRRPGGPGGTVYRDVYQVTRRREHQITVVESGANIYEQLSLPRFETHSFQENAPIRRVPDRS